MFPLQVPLVELAWTALQAPRVSGETLAFRDLPVTQEEMAHRDLKDLQESRETVVKMDNPDSQGLKEQKDRRWEKGKVFKLLY